MKLKRGRREQACMEMVQGGMARIWPLRSKSRQQHSQSKHQQRCRKRFGCDRRVGQQSTFLGWSIHHGLHQLQS
uniref:Uncharacterized protein n=1 Tax=Lepeophtheirus salmonis TaxID=72036 RepID=A0A0K2VI28_LEPSM